MKQVMMMKRQKGAALVIGLMLLVVLTLLAVTGMNTASMELVMAGNEQYRQRAFQASETGIEQAVPKVPFIGQSCSPVEIAKSPNSETGTTYKVTSQYMGDHIESGVVRLHYELRSEGTSSRNANALHIQGTYVSQNSGDVTYGSGCMPAAPQPDPQQPVS
jgi:type IV pilus assembly protein PilX